MTDERHTVDLLKRTGDTGINAGGTSPQTPSEQTVNQQRTTTYTPMRLWTLLFAVTSTVLIAAAYAADAATPASIVNPALSNGLWAIATLSWTGHLAAVCRDTILRRIEGLADVYSDASDQRAGAARLDGMRLATEVHDPRPTLVRP